MLTLAEVIGAITGQSSSLGRGQPVTDVVIDSRLAIPGPPAPIGQSSGESVLW